MKVVTVRPHEVEAGDRFLGSDVPIGRLNLDCTGPVAQWEFFDYAGELIVRKSFFKVTLLQVQRPQGVSEESAVGNDAVSDRAADPPSSDTQDSSTGDLPGCLPTMSRESGARCPSRVTLPAMPATDDDWSTPVGMTWEQRPDRPSWHPDDCQLDCCWRRTAIAVDEVRRISDDTPPHGISRPFYVVKS